MNRILQTVLGVAMLGFAAVLALGAIRPTADGAVSMAWPVAVVVLAFTVMGGFFVSKSLMTDALKTLAGAARKARRSGSVP